MTRWLILSSILEFNELNTLFNKAFGYPTFDAKTMTYALPIIHPNHANTQLAMAIEERCLPYLTEAQIDALKSYDELVGLDFIRLVNEA